MSQPLTTKTNWLHDYQAKAEWALEQKAGSAQSPCPRDGESPRAKMGSWINPPKI